MILLKGKKRTKLDDAMLKLEKAEKVSCEILDVDVLAEVYTQIFDGRASWLSTCTSLLVSQTHSLHHLRRRRLSPISFLYFVSIYTHHLTRSPQRRVFEFWVVFVTT